MRYKQNIRHARTTKQSLITLYIKFNINLLRQSYSNIVFLFNYFGVRVTIEILFIKITLIILIIYAWLLLINICFLYDQFLLFLIITFYLILLCVFQIMSLENNKGVIIDNTFTMLNGSTKSSKMFHIFIIQKLCNILKFLINKCFSCTNDSNFTYRITTYFEYILLLPFNLFMFIVYYILHNSIIWDDLIINEWWNDEISSTSYDTKNSLYAKKNIKKIFLIFLILMSYIFD